MLKAQRDSIRLLRGILVASVVLPTALFGYAAWLGYHNTNSIADRQIDQTRDVITEHALKVFESVERSLAEITEIVRDQSDSQIMDGEATLHLRLKRIAAGSEQVKSLWIFDSRGRALVSSLGHPPPTTDYSDRDYFQAHVERDVGTFIGQILRPRLPGAGAPFFSVSRRRPPSDGRFTGVIQASLLPDYFEGFFAKISREAGGYAALVREDGSILARHPAIGRNASIGPNSGLGKRMLARDAEGTLTMTSAVDNVERKLAYRKLADLPVYVVSGLETRAIRANWLATLGSYLIFGLPATLALIAIVMLALTRTQRLYEEASRRQTAEKALKEAQRLESLGRLTGGVAHDFNNLMMVVGGSAQRLRRRHSDPQDRRALDMIDSAVDKATALTRQLLSFSRRHAVSARVIDLAECVDKFSDVLRQSVRRDIAIDIKRPAQPVPVRIDPNEFEIALLNLALNARDAMPDGGRIAIAIKRQRGNAGRSGEVAVLTFSDNGSGIAEDIRDRIFEPFFTTKSVDRGTGLGLSQIYGFVQQSKGEITVDSELGRGTTFRLSFPISDEAPHAEPAAADQPPPRVAQPTTLLLVEDHPDVAAVAADYAQQCGFDVIAANSAEAAVELLNRRRDIRLVFSDIVMPGMSGLELARLIREHHPDIAVVLASGYSDRSATAVEERFPLLQKPYTQQALRDALIGALGTTAAI
ncbi:two-component system NtrC family sensor kinase [Rhodopseudomonas rhenobacensis]|uniref:histidine kinase n=1 Tax=Rhodopseudomonas rhenobacensis TaxID=87461 RepID=A0A7W8E0A9_9BRAD|nr:hybrid sensor histidine kinase/response regulator [Rhodopseudomonas rhenobacensis]MBB5048918.1 two-component system NtrC family sensor kinase [Rhodopseudomonas rhenobacensis]